MSLASVFSLACAELLTSSYFHAIVPATRDAKDGALLGRLPSRPSIYRSIGFVTIHPRPIHIIYIIKLQTVVDLSYSRCRRLTVMYLLVTHLSLVLTVTICRADTLIKVRLSSLTPPPTFVRLATLIFTRPSRGLRSRCLIRFLLRSISPVVFQAIVRTISRLLAVRGLDPLYDRIRDNLFDPLSVN